MAFLGVRAAMSTTVGTRDPESESRAPRVLVLDPNAAVPLQTTDKSYLVGTMFPARCGCSVTYATSSAITAAQLAVDWDLVLVPAVIASDTAYTAISNTVGGLTTATQCPVFVMQAVDHSATATRRGITGSATEAAVATTKCLVNSWFGRTATRLTFYGEAATSLGAGAAAIFTDDGTNISGWRFDIGAHPTLWIAGSLSSVNAGTMLYKPWLGLQWMADMQPSRARELTIKRNLRRAPVVLRYDGLDDANSVTSYGTGDPADPLPALYAKAIAAGLPEIYMAALGAGGVTDPGASDATVAAWFAARDRSAGGLFRAVNHHTDIVDAGGGKACTTDGVTLDNEANATTEYRRVCDIITALGFQLGTDGYCAGEFVVQNGNDMNSPAAELLAKWGCYLSLARSEQYPNGTIGPPTATFYPYSNASHVWNGARYCVSESIDGLADSANTVSLTANQAILRVAMLGGFVYVHGGTNLSNAGAGPIQWIEEMMEMHRICPHVIASDSETLKTDALLAHQLFAA